MNFGLSVVQLGRTDSQDKDNGQHTGAVIPLLSGVPDYFDRNKISSGGDLSHYSSASLY